MKRKVTRKDFYMEIKKSPGRFLSILFIVALGVAFFSGIRASEPDMRITGDSYFDASELMDIKALSTFGVTEKDVAAMEELDGIEKAEGAYSADFLYKIGDEQQVLHVMSLQKEMNQVTVSKGRMPEATDECMADDESGYKIGDKIKLISGTEDPVLDTLKTDTLEVVGLGNSPCYLSYGRGSTTIGTGSVRAFLVVPEESFDMETYTEVYMRVKDAKEKMAFTDGYDDLIEDAVDRVEEIKDERGRIRRQEIVDDALEELADAKKELEDGKKDAEKELADAKKKIDDGVKELADAKKTIADGKVQIADAKKTLKAKQKELDEGRKAYQSGKKELEQGRKEYEKGLAAYKKSEPGARKEIENGRKELSELKAQIATDEKTQQQLLSEIEKLKQAIEESTGSDEQAEQIEQLKKQLEELEKQAGGLAYKIQMQKSAYSEADGKLNSAEKQLNNSKKQLDKSKKEIQSGEKKLKSSKKQLDSGQKQIDEGWKELKKQESTLIDGEKEIEKNEVKLTDAKKDYEEGKKEAEEEIADGEREIKEAEEDIENIEDPKWYVYDRNTLVEYSGFGENAERLGAIGKVFPVLFFLVAALISLTSMTRMVEEQRTSIGTMKALGYGKFAIASKYLGYALLATVGGSILGVLIGEKILPYIIVYAYGILYRHLPVILVPYDWGYALMASGAAIFCTMFATFFACYRELQAQPAVLMRPPAPKNGRRVFLERVGFLWRHLSFTWKSTVRNLARYKKRFFMTIFGIGGCMALMLVGFGLKDSCYEIAELQYSEIQLYDGSIYLEEDITEKQRADIQERLRKENSIQKYMNANMQSLTLVNGKSERQVYECVFEMTDQVPDFVDFHDRKTKEGYALSDNGVIVSEKTAKMLNADVGDTVHIKDEEKGNKEVRIEHICENYMGHYMYLTPAYYEQIHGEKPEYNSIFFGVKDEVSKSEMEKMGQKLLQMDGALNISYMRDVEKQLDDMLNSLNLVIVVLIISAGMLAFVVLYNLNTVNIAERKRELATLKVLGFFDMEVGEYVYRENIILTFIGAVVGVGLGNVLHRFIIETVEVDNAMFGRIINGPSYVYSLVLTVVFSLVINGVMYFKLKKIDMVESLKSIE